MMSRKIKACWIKPQDTQLRIISGTNSPLNDVFSEEILSYDAQMNYPYTTTLSIIRQLQSALGERQLEASILNLSAVPREQFVDGSWTEKYLSDVYKNITFGNSTIEARRIGLDISHVADLDTIVANQDLIAFPISFQTHVPEIQRLATYLRNRFGQKPKLMTSGTGIEGYEEKLLESGIDLIFVGTVTDRGEEVLEAIVDENYDRLLEIPGVYTNLGGKSIRNLGARNFRQELVRKGMIQDWKKRLVNYSNFVNISVRMVGRPDLATQSGIDPSLEYCCSMQDLPFNTISKIVSSGKNVVFAADEYFPTIGCPRVDCDFCHAAGKGYSQRNSEYSIKLLNFYKNRGATDLIPTDDQILLLAVSNKEFANNLIDIYEHARKLGFTFFYGNGIETYSLAQFIQKSTSSPHKDERLIYTKLLELFFDTTSYIYLPYENVAGLSDQPERAGLKKLKLGRSGFENVLHFLDESSHKRGSRLEVGTNIIYSENINHEEIWRYYQIMDSIVQRYPNLNIRYNGFFMIPNNSAKHVIDYRKRGYKFLPDPEIMILSIPTIIVPGTSPETLEKMLAFHIKARDASLTRRKLKAGTYRA